jgi:hypothetical protein
MLLHLLLREGLLGLGKVLCVSSPRRKLLLWWWRIRHMALRGQLLLLIVAQIVKLLLLDSGGRCVHLVVHGRHWEVRRHVQRGS